MSGEPTTDAGEPRPDTQTPPLDRPLRPTMICIACLIASVIGIYGQVVSYGFTNWDDNHYIKGNRLLTEPTGANLQRIFTPRSIPREQLYIPVTYASHWLESRLFGLRPRVVHTGNLLLHIINVILLFLLLLEVGCPRLASLVGAAAFAMHPLQAEAVSWCMGRKDLLATAFALGAMHCYLRQLRGKHWAWLLPCVVLVPAAMLAKPSVILLPAILLLLHLLSFARIKRVHWGFIGACAAFAGIVYHINTFTSIPPALAEMPAVGVRLAAVPALLVDTLVRLVGMYGLSPIYGWPQSMGVLVSKCFAAAAIGIGAAWLLRKHLIFIPVVMIIGLAFFPAVVLVVQYREFFTADRYCYFPMVGVAWILAMVFSRLVIHGRKWGTGIIAAWLIAAAVVCSMQVRHWRNSLSIWQRAANFAPTNSLVFNNLGSALVEQGRREQAVEAYERSLLLNPKNFRAWNNLAEVSLRLQRYDEAIAACSEAVRLNPNYPQAHHNWGLALLGLAKYPEAVDHFRISAQHGDIGSIRFLGLAFERQKQYAKAEICYRQLIKRQPSPDAHFLLARLLADQGKSAEAIAELDRGLKLGAHAEAAGLRIKLLRKAP